MRTNVRLTSAVLDEASSAICKDRDSQAESVSTSNDYESPLMGYRAVLP